MADTNDGVIGSTTEESADLALLNNEEPQIEDTKETKATAKGEESPEPEAEESPEPQLDEAKEDDEEEKADKSHPPYDRPSIQELKKEFPEIFKKFPSLRDVYYREQEFSQLFSTIEDAQAAATNAEAYDDLSNKILSGRSEELFNAVKSADGKAFEKMADSILPTLFKISPDVHWRVLQPTMQNLVRGFYLEGEKRDSDNIKNAAEYLADFIFGDIKFATENRAQPRIAEESEESKQLKRERQEFETQKYNSFFSSVKSSLDNEMISAIDAKKVDPDKIFSPFIRDTIIGKVRIEIDKQLASDKAHLRFMASLWEKARKEGYSDGWKSRIQSAYLARAKSLIPSIRAKFVAEAQGSSAKASESRKESVDKTMSRREAGSGGRTSRESGGPINPKKVDWSNTSDLDLLNGNVTFKK